MTGTTSLENDLLRVDIDTEPTLRIRLTDKRSGFVWECPGAPFTLHYWQACHFSVRSCAATHDRGWEFRLLPDEETVSVQCTWPRAACGFRAVFRLDGPVLEVLFHGRRMVENRRPDIRLMGVDVLPGFGGARTGEAGHLLLPLGRGALCRFDKTAARETSMLFYADGDRALTAPVFGTCRGDAGFLGIVDEDEFNAELIVAANGGADRNLNFVHPRLRTRFHASDALDEDAQYRLRYVFLNGEDASAVGMAKAYRNHLLDTRNHPTLAARMKRGPSLAALARALTVNIHLAEKRLVTRMSGDGDLAVKTRFDEAAQIAQKIKDAGVEHADIVFVGWNCEGKDGLYPTRFPVESAVGGAEAMSRAVAAIQAMGFQTGALDNYTDLYRRSPAFNVEFSAKQLGGEPWRGGTWAGGQSYVVCPSQARERYAHRDMRRLRDLGLDGMLFLDHCPGPGVFACHDAEHPATRADYAGHVVDLIHDAQGAFGVCRTSGPHVFAALAAETCMFPVQDTPGVHNLEEDWFADEVVPFLPVALHGVVLLAADARADLLRAVEFGAAPVYDVTQDEADGMVKEMSDVFRRYVKELAPLAAEFIESHETQGEGVVAVGYSNGAEVLINRTDDPVRIRGVEVQPRDFTVKK